MTNSPTRHLVAVWNPSYAADALDEHVRILLEWAERARAGEDPDEDVYVWWARSRSKHRLQNLPHLQEVLALKSQIESDVETHLYMTDYRSLYVAKLGDLNDGNLLTQYPEEAEHLPAYSHDLPADLYFQLWDIRRLVADDTVGAVEELSKLRNVRYDLQPVSLYGGMIDLPLIVERPSARLWFSDDGQLTQGRLWAEHDAMLRSETERMSRELRENLFGDDIWSALEPGTRAFLASGEATYRSRRHDTGFDFSGPAVEFAKAVETELNAIVFGALRSVYGKGSPVGRVTNVDGRQVDLGAAVPHQPLGVLLNLLDRNDDVKRGLRIGFGDSDAEALIGEMPHYLKPIVDVRNPAAHSRRIKRAEATTLREFVTGIGCEGVISKLARIKLRTRGKDA
ncbi:MAG: hypothetical protein ACREMA_00220 [Longimicrobiales bacterium]